MRHDDAVGGGPRVGWDATSGDHAHAGVGTALPQIHDIVGVPGDGVPVRTESLVEPSERHRVQPVHMERRSERFDTESTTITTDASRFLIGE
jgi:hypothetical protein